MKNIFKRKPITLSTGHKVRPAKGKCPDCGAGERDWCKNNCKLIDMANMARE